MIFSETNIFYSMKSINNYSVDVRKQDFIMGIDINIKGNKLEILHS